MPGVRRQGHGDRAGRHADAVPARPLPGSRSGPSPGPPERRRDDPVRPDPARRDGDPRGDGPADARDLVAVTCPAIFLDKDGTLIEDLPYNVDPRRIRFAPGAREALPLFHEAGYAIVLITNQSGVARGYFTEPDLAPVRDRLEEMVGEVGVPLAAFYACPHHPQGVNE